MSRVAARCPSCRSVFFVSAAQGKVANNLVRCGRCGHLFDVLENRSENPPEPESTPNPPETEREPEAVNEAALGHNEVSYAAIDHFEEDASQHYEYEGSEYGWSEHGWSEYEEYSSEEASPALNDLPAPTIDLSHLVPPLPDDFDLEKGVVEKQGFVRQFRLVLAIGVIAIIGLGGQFVYYTAPQLSQQLAYRPWLQRLCTLLPCELGAYSERRLVRVEHLQIGAHPDREDLLMVKLVLINGASLEQAYPPLLLRFSDLGGEQVAALHFSAEDYLPRSLSAESLMPVDKAVSIKFSISDPGKRALSYSVAVEE